MKIQTYIWPLLLLTIGSLQVIGYCANLPILRQIGQLTAASPLPLVFSHFRGLETFSPRFSIVTRSDDGTRREVIITPELYAKLGGPYNRRNVYGAAFAFGAVLNEEREQQMVYSVLSYGLCPGGPLRKILEGEQRIKNLDQLSIVIRPKYGLAEKELEVRCSGI